MTLLDTSIHRPTNRTFEELAGNGYIVFLDVSLRERPETIDLSLRGIHRKRVEAYWNGCAFVL